MDEFKINYVQKSRLTDEGVPVKELLGLLDTEKELNTAFLEALNIKENENDFIHISGAKELVNLQKSINKRFGKKDLKSSLNDIEVNIDENKLVLDFNNLVEDEFFLQKNLPFISATPIYSSKTDFFSWLYGMDKYAKELVRNGLYEILSSNLDLLKEQEIGNKERNYRILYDSKDNEFYVRAITSLDRYKDYDNNITVVIALLSLHKKMKELGIIYSLNRIEYNESYLRIFFEEENKRELSGLGFVKNLIEVSNDEIKRKALKFDAISNIEFVDSESQIQEIIIQPTSFSTQPKIKTNILAISHSLSPQKFVQRLEDIDNSVKIHDELFELINQVSKVTNPLQIMFIVKEMVRKAKNENFKKHRDRIEKIIDTHVVDNMIQLLTLFKKMELITENDIEANEYIRYIIYKSLVEAK